MGVLEPQWERRLAFWMTSLEHLRYREAEELAFTYVTTRDHLSADGAAALCRRCGTPVQPGTRWGCVFEYGWFLAEIDVTKAKRVLSDGAESTDLVVRPDAGGESLVYINRSPRGAIDRQHHEVVLQGADLVSETVEILIEAYAGDGPRVPKTGPLRPDVPSIPAAAEPLATVGRSSWGVYREDAYALLNDVRVLLGLYKVLDGSSLRAQHVLSALKRFTYAYDPELPDSEILASVREARRLLLPELSRKASDSSPTLYAFGHAHVDVAWLWPLAETDRKCARTAANQLELLSRYPEYRFIHSQAYLYERIKTLYPALYDDMKVQAREGRLLVEGALWVEPDTNLPSGESLIRQFLYGMEFLREEFGVTCKLLWLPDAFGYSGNLPQIMRGCGVLYFATAKLAWAEEAYGGVEVFPHNTFWWEGIDGSRVLAHMCTNYNSFMDPENVHSRWADRVQRDALKSRLMPFGWGDGGGGPSRDYIESGRRMANLEGLPRVRLDSPLRFFEQLEQSSQELPEYIGELYFPAHQGTYTSVAAMKRYNRRIEQLLREVELWTALSSHLADEPARTELFRDRTVAIWKRLLVLQFHDILPGTSISRVYEEALTECVQMVEELEQLQHAVLDRFVERTDDGRETTVFNSLAWDRTALLELSDPTMLVGGRRTVSRQKSATGDYLHMVDVPSLSARTVRNMALSSGPNQIDEAMHGTGASGVVAREDGDELVLENRVFVGRFNREGELLSLQSRETGRELLASAGNRFRLFQDIPVMGDAWDIDSMYRNTEYPGIRDVAVSIRESGPVRGQIEIRGTIGSSAIRQIVTLTEGSDVLEFDTQVDWNERHKLLKVRFAFPLVCHDALHEIQFGYMKRPTHRSTRRDADRYEVPQHRWSALTDANNGYAVLNDCKYGVSTHKDAIELTLLKASAAPAADPDRGRHHFRYGLYSWTGGIGRSEIVRRAVEFNVDPCLRAGRLRSEIHTAFRVDDPAVVIETVKLPERRAEPDEIVIRLYESLGGARRVRLGSSYRIAYAREVNMLERETSTGERATMDGPDGIMLEFGAFEVKTIRMVLE